MNLIQREDIRRLLLEFKDKFTEREHKILSYRFGLNEESTHALEETGKLFMVTKERIRQIEMKALDKLGTLLKQDKQPVNNTIPEIAERDCA